ncbi:hypothetical protein DFH06DRAFT_1126839 [Mycena polygramma]|nr:hypothetical protein DFH06DRAFT_1126839 [Mycena polygramma]
MQYNVDTEEFNSAWDRMTEVLSQTEPLPSGRLHSLSPKPAGNENSNGRKLPYGCFRDYADGPLYRNDRDKGSIGPKYCSWAARIQDGDKYLYRCYVIWGHQRKVAILPVLFMLSTLAVGIWMWTQLEDTEEVDNTHIQVMLGLAALTNIVLTGLTIGRILWVRRAATHLGLEKTIRVRYNTAAAIILEFGAIYCGVAVFLFVTASLNDERIFNIGTGVAVELLNIIPTFTLVYIGLQSAVYSAPAGNSLLLV